MRVIAFFAHQRLVGSEKTFVSNNIGKAALHFFEKEDADHKQ